MAFQYLKEVSFKLEQNIKILEEELCDASKFVYQDEETKSGNGIKILENIYKTWDAICKDLEETIKEEDVDEIAEFLNGYKTYVDEMELKQNECVNVLVQVNMLEPNSPEQQQYIEQNESGSIDQSQERKIKSPPLSPSCSPGDSTFLIARPDGSAVQHYSDMNNENETDLHNTICDFQPFKEPVNKPRKRLGVRNDHLRY